MPVSVTDCVAESVSDAVSVALSERDGVGTLVSVKVSNVTDSEGVSECVFDGVSDRV